MTPDPVQPQKKPSFSTAIASIIVMLPALMGSFVTYRASQSDSSAGYSANREAVVRLQTEVTELHSTVAVLRDRNERLETQVAKHDADLAKLMNALRVASIDESVPAEVKALPAPEPMPVLEVHPLTPPPETLQEAVKQSDAAKN